MSDVFNPTTWTNFGDATNWVRAIGFVLPMLTAVLTKRFAGSRIKSLVTLFLTALTAVVAQATTDGPHDLSYFVQAFFNTFVAAIASYYGFLKPTGITEGLAAATRSF